MASCDIVCQGQEMSGLFVNAKFGKPASIKLSLQAQTSRFRVCKWVHDIAGGKQAMVHSHPEKDCARGMPFWLRVYVIFWLAVQFTTVNFDQSQSLSP